MLPGQIIAAPNTGMNNELESDIQLACLHRNSNLVDPHMIMLIYNNSITPRLIIDMTMWQNRDFFEAQIAIFYNDLQNVAQSVV